MTEVPAAVRAWHEIAASRDVAALPALLADDVAFRSPAVHAPQEGRALATAYLTAAVAVLGPTLTYPRQWYGTGSAVLEFTARLDDLDVHGIDLIAWDEQDRIVEFTVMVRPLRALERLIGHMRQRLEAAGPV